MHLGARSLAAQAAIISLCKTAACMMFVSVCSAAQAAGCDRQLAAQVAQPPSLEEVSAFSCLSAHSFDWAKAEPLPP